MTILVKALDYQPNKVFGMDFLDGRKKENAVFCKVLFINTL